jgi:AraC-like DNA-binding protein
VALACGFSDQAHLCKVFRRTIGMSPSAWRRGHLTCPGASGRVTMVR